MLPLPDTLSSVSCICFIVSMEGTNGADSLRVYDGAGGGVASAVKLLGVVGFWGEELLPDALSSVSCICFIVSLEGINGVCFALTLKGSSCADSLLECVEAKGDVAFAVKALDVADWSSPPKKFVKVNQLLEGGASEGCWLLLLSSLVNVSSGFLLKIFLSKVLVVPAP